MKETSGEFSMTVVVIIGAILIVSFLTVMVGPMGKFIQDKWESMVDKAQTDAAGTGAAGTGAAGTEG